MTEVPLYRQHVSIRPRIACMDLVPCRAWIVHCWVIHKMAACQGSLHRELCTLPCSPALRGKVQEFLAHKKTPPPQGPP